MGTVCHVDMRGRLAAQIRTCLPYVAFIVCEMRRVAACVPRCARAECEGADIAQRETGCRVGNVGERHARVGMGGWGLRDGGACVGAVRGLDWGVNSSTRNLCVIVEGFKRIARFFVYVLIKVGITA